MVNKQVRIDPSALEILSRYAENPSEAIRTMHLRIIDGKTQSVSPMTQVAPAKTQFVTGTQPQPTQPVLMATHFDTTFWKKVGETVDSSIEKAKRY